MSNRGIRYSFPHQKRRRGDNFTEQEKQKLLDLITPSRLANLENKRSLSEVIHLKRITWISIMHDYNACFLENKRSVSEIKGLWKRLKHSHSKIRGKSVSLESINNADDQSQFSCNSNFSSNQINLDFGTNCLTNDLVPVDPMETTQETTFKVEPFSSDCIQSSSNSTAQDIPQLETDDNLNISGVRSTRQQSVLASLTESINDSPNFNKTLFESINSGPISSSTLKSVRVPKPDLPPDLLQNSSDVLLSMAREKHLKEMQLLDEQINYFKLKQHLKLKELEMLSRNSDN